MIALNYFFSETYFQKYINLRNSLSTDRVSNSNDNFVPNCSQELMLWMAILINLVKCSIY